MDRARAAGVIVCIASVLLSLLVAGGIFARSYWAVAIPVLAGLLAVMALAFWIGWTMATTEVETPGQRPGAENPTGSAEETGS